MTQPVRPRIPSPSVPTMLLLGIFLILLTAALRLGAGLLLPIAIAGLLTLLLDPPVRALRKLGLSTAVGAALMVFGTLGALVTGGVITGSTVSVVATALTVVFLTYFLLAMLPAFRKKLADLIGTRAGASNVEEVLTEIEVQMSRYLLVNTLTSAGVGLATWALLAGVGLPNALLWGVAAFLLNFIPYAGALVTVALVGAAALVSFDDTGRVLLVVGGCVAINLLEGNLITPHLLGMHLPLNPVAIFVSLLYWGCVWGPAGALLAVPITVMLQVIFARVEKLRPLAVLLDS